MSLSERFPPDDPREWLNRAKSNLAIAAWMVIVSLPLSLSFGQSKFSFGCFRLRAARSSADKDDIQHSLWRGCAVLVFAAIAGQRHKNYKRDVVKQKYNIDEPEQRVESGRRQKARRLIYG